MRAFVAIGLILMVSLSWLSVRGGAQTSPPAVPPATTGTGPSSLSSLEFEDQTLTSGLLHKLREGTPLNGLFPSEQSRYGAGPAVADYDRDGDLDVYFVSHYGEPNRLYQNDGQGQFVDVTDAAGVGDLGWGHMALFLDLDNDGWDDLVVVNDYGNNRAFPPTTIYRNQGNGTFEKRQNTGLEPVIRTVGGATAGDFDLDGDLDLFFTSWYDNNLYLYQNDGDFQFTDVTFYAGLWLLETIVNHWTPVFADFNSDGWPDIFCAVDFSPDYLFLNNQDGTFTLQPNSYHTGNDMGAAVADYDGDGDLDIYTTNITTDSDPTDCCNWLYENDGTATLSNSAPARGVQNTRWGWGTSFFDADLDGDLDLMAVNGWFQPVWDFPAQFFVNHGDGRFSEQAARVGLDHRGDSRALVPFDADNDGDLDLLVSDVLSRATYYENRGDRARRRPGDWLRVKLEGTQSNRNGVGARVFVIQGNRTLMREIIVGGSFYSGPPLEAHFGLGRTRGQVPVRVLWPSGIQQDLGLVPVNQVLTVTEQP